MFNYTTSTDKTYTKGALEIAMSARDAEKRIALLNAELKSDKAPRAKKNSDPILTLLTSFLSLVR